MDKKRILVVDDESGFTKLLKLTLEKTGDYVVLEENTGVAALGVARDFRPDLVLLDIIMPKADGGEIAARFKADPVLKDTPIVFLTAIVSKREAKSVGHIDGLPFISKPVSLEELKGCIEKYVEKKA
jgi:CheY-like chemotaxis protein